MGHTHTDDRLTIACPACAERVKADQEEARWASAPLRKVEWHCIHDADDAPVVFVRQVRVPAGATGDEITDRYPNVVGEAFVLALPDTVPMGDTDWAMETMDVERVVVGPAVEVPGTVSPSPTLFEVAP